MSSSSSFAPPLTPDPCSVFFAENPFPPDYPELKKKMASFCQEHLDRGERRIVLVTSGGTTVPFEKQTVRFMDNFSAGTRGSASAEHFIEQGYPVLFLCRANSLKPFQRHLNDLGGEHFLDMLEEAEDGGGVRVKDWALDKTRTLLRRYKACREGNRLLIVPFTTLGDYLWLLRSACEALSPWGPRALLYLAAAVADFYIPAEARSEHKMQSSEGAPEVKLNLVPKMLRPLVANWSPRSFVVSFKLETDPALLSSKARKALDNYQHNLVVGNLLHTRKTEVTIVTREEEQEEVLRLSQAEVQQGVEIESKIIAEIKRRHEKFISGGGKQNGRQ